MPETFSRLREDLLRGGVAPARVERYLQELRDHRADLCEHLTETGLSARDANREAERRLGSHDSLLLPMLADRRFRSLAVRAPALLYLAMPLAAQTLLVLAGIVLLAAAAHSPLRPALADLGSVIAMVCLVAPVFGAWLAILAAWRRRATMHWPVLGALALSVFAAALDIGITMPSAGLAGEISLALSQPAPLLLLSLFGLSLLPLPLRAVLVPRP